MKSTSEHKIFCAVYDFALLPYALGDVITWNIKTAIKARERYCTAVDIYLRVSAESCSLSLQSYINGSNYILFFSELYPAFQAHPLLRNLHLYSNSCELISDTFKLKNNINYDLSDVESYESVISLNSDFKSKQNYLFSQVHLHNDINKYYFKYHELPQINTKAGSSDLELLFAKVFADKYIVIIQPRFRQLDKGFGGNQTYERDSDYLEWYDFISSARTRFPNVLFILLGRIAEKPLSFLKLENVVSLRMYGCTLLHEISLFSRANLFIGASSGFAAIANFTDIPYYITKITKSVCNVYQIPYMSEKLPFANQFQRLIYEPESSEMLSSLLARDIPHSFRKTVEENKDKNGCIDLFCVTQYMHKISGYNSTITRLEFTAKQEAIEVALLIQNKIRDAIVLPYDRKIHSDLLSMLQKVSQNFAFNVYCLPEYWKLMAWATDGNKQPLAKSIYIKRYILLELKRSAVNRSLAMLWYFQYFSGLFTAKFLKLSTQSISYLRNKLH